MVLDNFNKKMTSKLKMAIKYRPLKKKLMSRIPFLNLSETAEVNCIAAIILKDLGFHHLTMF